MQNAGTRPGPKVTVLSVSVIGDSVGGMAAY